MSRRAPFGIPGDAFGAPFPQAPAALSRATQLGGIYPIHSARSRPFLADLHPLKRLTEPKLVATDRMVKRISMLLSGFGTSTLNAATALSLALQEKINWHEKVCKAAVKNNKPF